MVRFTYISSFLVPKLLLIVHITLFKKRVEIRVIVPMNMGKYDSTLETSFFHPRHLTQAVCNMLQASARESTTMDGKRWLSPLVGEACFLVNREAHLKRYNCNMRPTEIRRWAYFTDLSQSCEWAPWRPANDCSQVVYTQLASRSVTALGNDHIC